jgi:hypothetical protein
VRKFDYMATCSRSFLVSRTVCPGERLTRLTPNEQVIVLGDVKQEEIGAEKRGKGLR